MSRLYWPEVTGWSYRMTPGDPTSLGSGRFTPLWSDSRMRDSPRTLADSAGQDDQSGILQTQAAGARPVFKIQDCPYSRNTEPYLFLRYRLTR